MPLQNRVTPTGDIIRSADRGAMMGNRGGRFHTAERELSGRHWHSKQWICCVLQFKNRHRPVMAPRHYTELFFLDEATALTAGHRPCFECRREAAVRFATLWNAARGLPGRARADAMDDQLHLERMVRAVERPKVSTAQLRKLPDGAMVCAPKGVNQNSANPSIALLWGGQLNPWSTNGYGPAQPFVDHPFVAHPAWCVLTPPAVLSVLERGYRPIVHESVPTT
jgi:hypothetical protein